MSSHNVFATADFATATEYLQRTLHGGKYGAFDWGQASDEDIIEAPVIALEAGIESGKLTAERVVSAFFQRAKKVNEKINAVCEFNEQAVEQAKGLDEQFSKRGNKTVGRLHGIPISLKDHIGVAGMTHNFSAPVWKEYRATTDSSLAARLKKEGAIILCKTTVPELGLAFDTGSTLFGQTRNPYQLDLSAGGSSGGEGALIAARGSPLGFGSDVGGSLRVPASYDGIVSLKPTQGRFPMTGCAPGFEWYQMFSYIVRMLSVGPLGRYVEDLEFVTSLVSGCDYNDPQSAIPPFVCLKSPPVWDSLRVGYFKDTSKSKSTEDVHRAIDTALDALRGAGVKHFTESCPAMLDDSVDLILRAFCRDGGAGVRNLVQLGGVEPSPHVTYLYPYYETKGIKTFEESDKLTVELDDFRSAMLRWVSQFDVIISPATFSPALPPAKVLDPQLVDRYVFCFAWNVAQFPGVVVGGIVEAVEAEFKGLPVAVQINGAPFQDSLLLEVGKMLQRSVPAAHTLRPSQV